MSTTLRADIEATVKEWRKEAARLDGYESFSAVGSRNALGSCAAHIERLISQHTQTDKLTNETTMDTQTEDIISVELLQLKDDPHLEFVGVSIGVLLTTILDHLAWRANALQEEHYNCDIVKESLADKQAVLDSIKRLL